MNTKNYAIIPLLGGGLVWAMLIFSCKTAPDRITESPPVTSPDMPISLHEPLTNVKNTTHMKSETQTSSITDLELLFSDAVALPKGSVIFWKEVMSDETIEKYKAQGYMTFCNRFVGDTILKYFGKSVYSKVFPNGIRDPNTMHTEWQSNPNLIPLVPGKHHILDIQGYANKGYLVLLSYIWTWGHLAFVGSERLEINTVPASPLINGKMGKDLDESWLPVVVQAGTYTGVTSAGYASNGWIDGPDYPLFNNGTVRFYLVKQ